MNKNIVCKFGGTSLASSENITKVKEIVLNYQKVVKIFQIVLMLLKQDLKILKKILI